ncbi:MAG: ion transporter [Lachnospiraceae bacterium]|nr:ion transporter [Lachnospiraceae bacterium]
MKKVKALVENSIFENIILGVIVFNSILMGLQTSESVVAAIGPVLTALDWVCLAIFIVEIILKFLAYGFRFFTSGWNIFDLIIVIMSLFSGFAFLRVFRTFRVFRAFRSLKALKSLKGMRSLRMVSGLKNLRIIVEAIGESIPGIFWSAILLLLVYYMFALMGTTLFGPTFPDWFGTMGKSMYTLFQVMTLESWSMGISRPVMEVFEWAWLYFVPFVLIASFLIMNVVVGIVVNAISEVSALEVKEEIQEAAKEGSRQDQILEEVRLLKEQLNKVEALLDKDNN